MSEFSRVKAAAEEGSAEEAHALSLLYAHGKNGAPWDKAEARKWHVVQLR